MKTRHQEGTTEDSSVSTNVSHLNTNQTSLKRQKDSSSDWSKKRVGGFWIKKDVLGNNYLSGSVMIEDEKPECFHIFKNRSEAKNQPDRICYKISSNSEREEVGAFWIKKSKKGKDYLSGVIRRPNKSPQSVHIYPNDFKQGNQPLYNCYLV